MNGIEILNTITVAGTTHIVMWIIIIVVGILLMITSILKNDAPDCFAVGFTAVALGIFFWVLETKVLPPTTTTRYQIIIDESVSAQDLLEKYNVIEIDGKIITVELKDGKIS